MFVTSRYNKILLFLNTFKIHLYLDMSQQNRYNATSIVVFSSKKML